MPTPTRPDSLSYESNGHSVQKCQWIVFDAVGTLIEPSPPVSVAYHSVGARLGSQLSVEEVGRRFRKAFRASETDQFPNGPQRGALTSSDPIEEARWRWIVGEVFSDVEDRERCFRELWDHFARPSSWRCFEDVGPSLRRLSDAGFRLAVASNFDRRLHDVCDALPELKSIELRVVSAAVGFRKPAAAFYTSLIAACGCDADQILMIGDSYEHDVQGPVAASMRAMHLDRRSDATDDVLLRSLLDLVCRLVE